MATIMSKSSLNKIFKQSLIRLNKNDSIISTGPLSEKIINRKQFTPNYQLYNINNHHFKNYSTGSGGRSLSKQITSSSSSPLTIFNEEEMAMKESVARLAKEKFAPLVKEMDEKSVMSPEVLKALFDNGLMNISIDTKYNGCGFSFLSTILAVEELAKVDASISVLVDVHNTLFARSILVYGSEQQKAQYLPRLAKDLLGSFCLSESHCGSDAFALKSTAKKVTGSDDFILNGTKSWITNAEQAGAYVIFVNANLSVGYKGITAFLVDRNTKGLSLGRPENKLGIRASSTCSVIMDDVRVSSKNILGKCGEGYKIAIELLNEGRIGIGAQMVGLAQGAFEHSVKYTLERTAFKQKIFDFQAMQHQIADIATKIEMARLLIYNAARLKEADLNYLKQAAMAKYYASEIAVETANKAIEWMGGVGFTKDYPVEKYLRDSKIGQIYEGTSNIQLNTIAKVIRDEFSK